MALGNHEPFYRLAICKFSDLELVHRPVAVLRNAEADIATSGLDDNRSIDGNAGGCGTSAQPAYVPNARLPVHLGVVLW